jgi:predicted Mrr-cat superfamily restriction endonuclease
MGYHARVTQASADGGIDVIAHRDGLGFEPPIIKVQCKQTLSTNGRPDVQKLYGAIEKEEKGLFVTLGSFSTHVHLSRANRTSASWTAKNWSNSFSFITTALHHDTAH